MGFYKTFKSHMYTSLNLLFSIVYGYCFNTSNGCQFIVQLEVMEVKQITTRKVQVDDVNNFIL